MGERGADVDLHESCGCSSAGPCQGGAPNRERTKTIEGTWATDQGWIDGLPVDSSCVDKVLQRVWLSSPALSRELRVEPQCIYRYVSVWAPRRRAPCGPSVVFCVEKCPTMITMACSTAILYDTMSQYTCWKENVVSFVQALLWSSNTTT
jgi:hypothetical protein